MSEDSASKRLADAIAVYMDEHDLEGVKGHDKAAAALKREQPKLFVEYAEGALTFGPSISR